MPVILDCDPGHDDALAILLALARPEIRLLGITTVAGNATLEHTTRNALSILALVGRSDIPVASGADRPLTGELRTAPHVHGASGIDGADLPEPERDPVSDDAVGFMAEAIAGAGEPVTLIPTGPLTNIAHLLRRHPDVRGSIAHICLMGGSMGEGNITPSAEFNIWVDPEAAVEVFEAGITITMIGLDVTHQAIWPVGDAQRLEALGTRTGRAFAGLLRYFGQFHRERYGWDGPAVHDAVAVAHVLGEGIVRTERHRIDVETAGDLTRGRTVVDRLGITGRPANVDVGVGLERERFLTMLFEAVATFP